MNVLRMVLILVVGGVVGLIAVPFLPEKAEDWVTSWQNKLSDATDQGNVNQPSPTAIDRSAPPIPRSFGPAPSSPEVPKPAPTYQPALRSTRAPESSSTHSLDLKLFMLDLINTDRASSGLAPVELGRNPAAQRHAQELFQDQYLGHWGLDGMKPYMRYTLAGGSGAEAENVSGPNETRAPGARYVKTPVKTSLIEAQQGLMTSPGHRSNILDPWHQRVNLGIACDDVTCTVVQQFEHNYVRFDRVPSIANGRLTFSGQTLDGFVYKSAQVWYDQLPEALQAAQVGATYCYDSGTPIVFIRKPVSAGSFYARDVSDFSWPDCRDPSDVDPTAPSRKALAALEDKTGRVPWVDADSYQVAGANFDVGADLTAYLAQHGQGVYGVVIWGDRGGESVALTNYSIFVGPQ